MTGELPLPLETLITLGRQAGARIMEIYRHGFSVREKGDHTPVTEADMAAHRLIGEGLERLTPEIPVLTEESETIPWEERQHWRRYWLVDPLDGTREFIRRNGEFTVNIALIEAQRPRFGLIHAPATGTIYHGIPGTGAWRIDGNGDSRPIRTRRPRRAPPVIAGSRAPGGERIQRFLTNLGPHRIIRLGSALKSCLVAEGGADLYPRFGPTSEWDTAAAQAIVEAAGGAITDTSMEPLRYNTKPSLLNPDFFVSGDPAADWSRYLPEDDTER